MNSLKYLHLVYQPTTHPTPFIPLPYSHPHPHPQHHHQPPPPPPPLIPHHPHHHHHPPPNRQSLPMAKGCNNEAQSFLSRGGQVIVRMRGLPYDCTVQQVIEFFSSGGVKTSCQVMDGSEGVLFVRKSDGRATGDAFVLFDSEESASKALTKHRELIGSRYIELFRSSTAEVQQVLNRTMANDNHNHQTRQVPQPFLNHHNNVTNHQIDNPPPSTPSGNSSTSSTGSSGPGGTQGLSPLLPTLPPPPIPSQVPSLGLMSTQSLLAPVGPIRDTRARDCIRLRGLPYEAQVEQILDFLAEHSKSIVFQGVHMVYNQQGQPSGEAFIQMDGEGSAHATAQSKHHKYMSFGKKQRYIEVFQCSIDDMNIVLMGGVPARGILPPSLPPPPIGAHPVSTFNPFQPFGAGQGGPTAAAAAVVATATAAARAANGLAAANPATYYPFIYWPYPSPPISPTTYYTP